MTERQIVSPPPEPLVDDLVAVVERTCPSGAEDRAAACLQWLRALRADPEALDALETARRDGIDLPRVLVAAAACWTGRRWMTAGLMELTIGPVRVAPHTLADIDELIAAAERAEEVLGHPSADAAELRALREHLEESSIDTRPGEVLTALVPDGSGGWREQRFVAGEAAVLAAPATIVPVAPAVRPRRGAPGDAALNVLVDLVFGHVWAVTGERRQAMVADLIVRGLRMGLSTEAGGPAVPVEAMRQRVIRAVAKPATGCRERASRIAGILGLTYRVD